MRVEDYTHSVNKLPQNVGLETWIWRQIVTSQRAHAKYKWRSYAAEWTPPPWKYSAYATGYVCGAWECRQYSVTCRLGLCPIASLAAWVFIGTKRSGLHQETEQKLREMPILLLAAPNLTQYADRRSAEKYIKPARSLANSWLKIKDPSPKKRNGKAQQISFSAIAKCSTLVTWRVFKFRTKEH